MFLYLVCSFYSSTLYSNHCVLKVVDYILCYVIPLTKDSNQSKLCCNFGKGGCNFDTVLYESLVALIKEKKRRSRAFFQFARPLWNAYDLFEILCKGRRMLRSGSQTSVAK